MRCFMIISVLLWTSHVTAFSTVSFVHNKLRTTTRYLAEEAPEPTADEASQDPPPPPPPQQPVRSPPQVKAKRLDPLVASLTRNDADEQQQTKTIQTPLFEVPVDGSLVVLLPTAVIAVVGLLASIYVGMNSQDAIVSALNDLSEELTTTAVQRTNVAAPEDGACRGICANDSGDFVGKKFMESLAKQQQQQAE